MVRERKRSTHLERVMGHSFLKRERASHIWEGAPNNYEGVYHVW